MRWFLTCASILIVVATAPRVSWADDFTFFESKIRPVLVKECYGCHAADSKKIRGGLKLDTKTDTLAGGESGPAVVPGRPDESLIVSALRHDGLEMPPRSKLPESVVADFAEWIKSGAPDPRVGTVTPKPKSGIDVEAGRKFWAYQPPVEKEVHAPKETTWLFNDIDRYLLSALDAKGIKPVADADRATLIRRLTFDLTGLPPTPDEIDCFENDRSKKAYENLVDRLLESPRFGERWGRHWLDVARFAESLTLRGFVFKDAWRYRDYVVESFNADRPFDQFVREQIAGDLLADSSLEDRRRGRIATTFLMLGNTNLEDQDKMQLEMDVVDEQLDTTCKAFLAQTVGCARCHDHKFDPIPTRDYYALAGIFKNVKSLEHANVSKWLDIPLPVSDEDEAGIKARETRIAVLESRVKSARSRIAGKNPSEPGIVSIGDIPGIVVDDSQALKVGEWKVSQAIRSYVGAGYSHDLDTGKGTKTITFQPVLPGTGQYEVWLAYVAGANRAKVPVTVFGADGEKTIPVDMTKTPPILGHFLSLGKYRFEKDGQTFVILANDGTQGHVIADAVVFLPTDQEGNANKLKSASPMTFAADEAIVAMETELKALKKNGPKRETAMSVSELPRAADIKIHIRGSVHNLGEIVPRGFLEVATRVGERKIPPTRESGRRELAAWLGSNENPLTARVYVNRAWHWLFGAGLVRTVDNFGTTGETPSHPELLDHLALAFMADGWSVKRLVRRIVLSHAYQIAAKDDPCSRQADPENRLLWRSNRRRLDAECLRDAILATSGRLNLTVGGRTFPDQLDADYGFKFDEPRRSLYVPVFRNALSEALAVFDFADPSMVVGRRDTSTVAQQALFLMNHPFVIEESKRAAQRLDSEHALDDRGKVNRAYRLVLGRVPTGKEIEIALQFVKSPGDAEDNWGTLFQALFASVDFRDVR